MKAVKTLFLLTLFGIGFLFGNYALAATEVTGGCCDTTIVFNNPEPDQSYNIGDTINFSGRFRVTGCGDGLFFNKVTFYITEDKEIPTTNCCGDTSDVCRTGIENCSCPEGCQNCYGATSTTYTHCNFTWCDEVRVLNLSGYKTYKLGEIYPPDVGGGAISYRVEYNQSFIIPSDLGFSGPVRFYVQYSGTHWASHWHWNITYQKGRIITYPDIPTELSESWNDCADYELSLTTFNWNYSHPDGYSQTASQIRIHGETFLETDELSCPPTCISYAPGYVPYDYGWVRENLLFGEKTYFWQVRVKDNHGNWSDWSNVKEFKTRRHPYPWIDFSWSPERPSQEEIVVFNPDESQTFDNLPINEANFEWIITQGDGTFTDGTNANSQYPHIKFSTLENRVKLRIEDSFGCWCDPEKNIDVQVPLPQFKEIPPIIWLRNLFAGIFNFLSPLFRV